MFKRSRKKNYAHNTEHGKAYLSFPMINGQGKGDIAQLRYGLSTMSYSGCEVISVYNALVYLGIPRPIHDIALYMERYRVMLGYWGCNVYCLGKALGRFGVEYERVKTTEESKAFIVSYWTGKRFRSSIHSVFCVRKREGIVVYNQYNNCQRELLYKTDEEVIGKLRLIAVYRITGVAGESGIYEI